MSGPRWSQAPGLARTVSAPQGCSCPLGSAFWDGVTSPTAVSPSWLDTGLIALRGLGLCSILGDRESPPFPILSPTVFPKDVPLAEVTYGVAFEVSKGQEVEALRWPQPHQCLWELAPVSGAVSAAPFMCDG